MNIVRDCRYGKMIFNPDDFYIGRGLDLYGEFSEKEVEIWRLFVKPGDLVIDAGANIGCHTVAFSSLVGKHGRVLSFEPERSVYHVLCGNLAINNIHNVHPFNAAVGDRDGSIQVPCLDYEQCKSIGTLELDMEPMPDTPYYPVPLYMIDSIKADRCDFIKIDVEGMELKVLQGATQFIDKFQPIVYVENDRTEHSLLLKRAMIEHGYTVYQHLPGLFNPNNFYGVSKNIFGTTSSVNLLCLPKGKTLPFEPDFTKNKTFLANPDDYIELGDGLKI